MAPNFEFRRSGFMSNIPVVTRYLIIINVIVFVITMLSGKVYSSDGLSSIYKLNLYLGIYSPSHPSFGPWQIITHFFAHADGWHIGINMFMLYMFGKYVENELGQKKFLTFYVLCAFAAAAANLLVYYFQGTIGGPMIGASGAVFGVMMGFAMLYPNTELMLLFPPIPIKAKYLIPIYMAFELFMGVRSFEGDNIAHFAHLGGAVCGFILLKIWGIRSRGYF